MLKTCVTSFLRYHITSHTKIYNNIMIKSTKLERAAIEARLRDALAIKGNSDIESTLNTIIDYNNVEEIFLRLHAQYEYLFIVEYHNRNTFAGQYKGSGAKYDLEHHRVEFIKSFNELAELFSNVVEVQRQKRKTDQIIDTESKGAASIVRGGKNHGVHISASAATAIGKPVKLKSVNCLDCGKKLAFSTPGNSICNSCFLKTLVYVCQDCKQTFAPSDVRQKTCVSCQNINASASIIAGVAIPKKNFIQRFFSALFKMV